MVAIVETLNWVHNVLSGLAIIISMVGLRGVVRDYFREAGSLGLVLVFIAILSGSIWSAFLPYVVKLPIYMSLSMDIILLTLTIGLYYILIFEELTNG